MPIARSLMTAKGKSAKTGALTSNGTIATGSAPIGICCTPDGNNVYTCNYTSNNVSIYSRNPSTGALTNNGTIASLGNQTFICSSPDGANLYVGLNTGGSTNLQIFNRNTTTGALTNGGAINGGYSVKYLCVSPDGKNLYTVNYGFGRVSIFNRNITTGALTANGTISTVNNYPSVICVSSNGTNVYCGTGSVVAIYSRNTTTGVLTSNGTVTVGYDPDGIAITSDGKQIYYVSNFPKNIYKHDRDINTGALSSYTSITTTYSPFPICASYDGVSVYVGLSGVDVGVFSRDKTTGVLTNNGTVGSSSPQIYSICISPDDNHVYACNINTNTIYIYTRS